MKKRQMRLAACLLAGMVLATSMGATPVYATETGQNTTTQVSGLSLVLPETTETEEADALQEGVKEAAAVQEQVAQAVEEKYASLGVAQVSNYVNVRSAATTDSEIVGCMENNAVATIEGEENGWYKITSGSISGYVLAEYLVVGNKDLVDAARMRVAVVQVDSLRVRTDASETASVKMKVNSGTSLEVLDTSIDGWVKVSTSEGEGYVSSAYVELSDGYLTAKELTEVCGGQAVVTYALQFIGNPYVWGGTSLTNGTDCSGFVMSVYAHFGVSLPHSSAALRSVGTGVDYSEAQPGDIICYSGHVGIYIGNGQIVNAANPSAGIKISSATYAKILAVRRIFQ